MDRSGRRRREGRRAPRHPVTGRPFRGAMSVYRRWRKGLRRRCRTAVQSLDAWSIYDTFEGASSIRTLDFRKSAAARRGIARHDPNAQISCFGNGILVRFRSFRSPRPHFSSRTASGSSCSPWILAFRATAPRHSAWTCAQSRWWDFARRPSRRGQLRRRGRGGRLSLRHHQHFVARLRPVREACRRCG